MGEFEAYLGRLRPLTPHVDPFTPSAASELVLDAARRLEESRPRSVGELADWFLEHPDAVPVVGLAVGLSQEKLKNALKHEFGTTSWAAIARLQPAELATFFENGYAVLDLLARQLNRTFTFGEILVARAGARSSAIRAGAAGRSLEDAIEQVALDLGLDSATRTRFSGNHGRTAPCDLAIPAAGDAMIVVAAKGFDSTGSKLTDAVREIEEMADVRLPRQMCLAVVDGIGWKSRVNDLRRIHQLYEDKRIDGLYTLNDMERFRDDVREFARIRGLFSP